MQKTDYLHSLEITQWVRRTTELKNTQECYCYHLFKNNALDAILIADCGKEIQIETDLLAAICKAIYPSFQRKENLKSPTSLAVNVAILMGNKASSLSKSLFKKTLKTYSPAELVQNPALKKEVWQKLKKLLVIT